MFLKHLSFADLPMANIGNLAALAAAISVNRTLLCLPPLQFSHFISKMFVGGP